MPTKFRSDGWVKSAQGAAVPGAQIYICTQPANVDTVPPSPLANIFEDPDGLVPLEQPILTDGFGHYDFYAASGTYTVLVALSGTTQQVYPDQSIGLAGELSSSFLQTNGVNNPVQNKQNLQEGTGISITDDGSGNITIAATNTGSPSGSNLLFIGPQINGSGLPSGFSPDSVLLRIPASSVAALGSSLKVSIAFDAASTGNLVLQNSVVRRTLPGDVTFIDTTDLKWGGTVSPTFNTTATKKFTSDVCIVPVDTTHDLYIILRINVASSGGVTAADFSEVAIAKCSGEVFSVAYDTVSAIPNLGTLDASLSAQSLLISKVEIS
jgi:hypothetical protein